MKITLHLGAHKTASTYIQQRLEAARAPLAQHGVQMALASEIRDAISAERARLGALRPISRRPARLLLKALRELIDAAVDRGAERLVISEENTLGPMDTLLQDKPFYGRAAERLAALMPVFEGHELTLALCVRNYGSFYTSVWGFQMRERYSPFDEPLKERLFAREGGWESLVKALQRAVPGVPLVFWKYEDLATLEQGVFSALVGPSHGALIEPSGYRPLLGPSRKAIRRLEALSEEAPVTPEIVSRVLKVNSKAKGLVGYSPWTIAERRAWTQRYQSDLGAIRQLNNVMPLSP